MSGAPRSRRIARFLDQTRPQQTHSLEQPGLHLRCVQAQQIGEGRSRGEGQRCLVRAGVRLELIDRGVPGVRIGEEA